MAALHKQDTNVYWSPNSPLKKLNAVREYEKYVFF